MEKSAGQLNVEVSFVSEAPSMDVTVADKIDALSCVSSQDNNLWSWQLPPVKNADTADAITIELDGKEDDSYYSFFQLLGGVLRLAEGQLDNLLAKLCP